MNKVIFSLAVLLAISPYASAERLFDIEVLVFTQPNAAASTEQFDPHKQLKPRANQHDLLTEAFTAQLKQQCLDGNYNPNPSTPASPFCEAATGEQSPCCDFSEEKLLDLSKTPVVPTPPSEPTQLPYLLAEEQLQLASKRTELRKIGRKVLLHTAWRFAEKSNQNAENIRIFAGKMLAADNQNESLVEGQSEQNAKQATDPNSVFSDPNVLTTDPQWQQAPTVAMPLWQLDGFVKVHVKRYLYVDAEFALRQQGDTQEQISGHFSQFKRVISGEIHYFDHPQMGMIIQIRRAPENNSTTAAAVAVKG